MVKNPPANAVDARNTGLIPRWARFPAEGNGNPPQHSCLAWWAIVHRATESGTTEHML